MSVSPKKELGQHFLVDENILGVIGRLAALEPSDVVLEIGPGLGVLTRYLAQRVAHVHAVELDASLEPYLRDAGANVTLHLGDALRLDLAALAPDATKLVANLPYNIATPLLVESLDGLPNIDLWCVMVQREVADRLFAQPRTKAYGAVSVLIQLATERTGFHPVSRTVFRPPPNVDSALVAFRRTGMPPDYAHVKKIVAAAFAHRRKTLPNSLELAGVVAARPRRRRAGADRPRAVDACRSTRAAGVRRARGGARVKAPAPAKINLGLVVGPLRDDGRHELLTVYQRLTIADRIELATADESARSKASPPTRSSATRSPRSQRTRTSSRAGASTSRSASRSPPASAAAAPTPRPHSGSRTTRSTSRSRPPRCTSSPRHSAPTFRSSSPTARSSAPATARRSRRSTSRRTSGSCSSCRAATQKQSTASVYAAFDARDGAAGWEERRAAFAAALDAVRRPRDLAQLPPNDLASSPLARELLALGAFHADVSGAGPAVYGLFHHRAPADAARRALRTAGESWLTAPAWYG